MVGNTFRCDPDGVPSLIQDIRYLRHDMTFEVVFFNSGRLRFIAELGCDSIGLMQPTPTPEQWDEAIRRLTELVESNWAFFRNKMAVDPNGLVVRTPHLRLV